MTHSNAWIALENNLALTWWDYYKWLRDGQEGPEPAIDPFGRNALKKLIDMEFAFECFKKANAGGKVWRCLAIWDVTHQQIDAGYSAYGDANSGGDFECVGLWWWTDGDLRCVRDETFGWQPTQVIKFMPDQCISRDPQGNCLQTEPATELINVQLAQGQPLLDFG